MSNEAIIADIERDGDKVKISYMWCGCGMCFNLKIEATPEGEETTVIETYSDFDDIKSGVIDLLARKLEELQKRVDEHSAPATEEPS